MIINGIRVYFPFPKVFPEQIDYITTLLSLLSSQGHCLLEMPSGSGKTISILSATVSYLIHCETYSMKKPKILYCSRTVGEIEKSLGELQLLYNFIQKSDPNLLKNFLGLGLSSRNVLCVNENARNFGSIEYGCHKLVCEKKCTFFENLEDLFSNYTNRRDDCTNNSAMDCKPSYSQEIRTIAKTNRNQCSQKNVTSEIYHNGQSPHSNPLNSLFQKTNRNILEFTGVYTLENLTQLGKKENICPYYLSRKLLSQADVIIFSYNYLIDPRIKNIVLKEIGTEAFVIFDEAHNIDSACIEALSVNIKRKDLDNCQKEIKALEEEVKVLKKENQRILNEEAQKLRHETIKEVDGFVPYQNINPDHPIMNTENHSKQIKDHVDGDFFDLNYEFAPGNIRNSTHFLSTLRRLTEYFKTKLKTTHMTTETTSSFCKSLFALTYVDKNTLSFLSTRLGHLIRTLDLQGKLELTATRNLCDFASLMAQHKEGFLIIFEPFDTMAASVFSPVLRLYCLDASIALRAVFKYKSVVITSGTLSPLNVYCKLLNFEAVVTKEIGIRLKRNCINPIIITKGNDQMIMQVSHENQTEDNSKIMNINENKPKNKNDGVISSSFTLRNDPSVIRNYGLLVLEFCKIVPDGLVVFFPSYIYMEEIITIWSESTLIQEIQKHKLIFIETPQISETEKALNLFKKANKNGKGGLLFSVARGKVSEGVDFKNENGRCVIVLGVPYQFTESIRLKKRLEYLETKINLRKSEFLNFDCMRQAAQCLGRVLRGKDDYGLMVLADYRFEKNERKGKLPKWILDNLEVGHTNLSIDMGVCIAKRFFREMAQPVDD